MTISPTPGTSATYARPVEFRVLGPVEVVTDRDRIGLGGPKQRTVLALLLAGAGKPVSADALITGVYGDDAAPSVRRSIQTYISNLRSELGDIIRFSGDAYTLAIDRSQVDALVFEDVVREHTGDGTEPEATASALRDALAMWRGHPYADVEAHGRLAPEITRLNELRMEALAARVDADLAAGRHRELIAELESLTVEHPTREEFRAQQMLALYRSGRQADALRAYERTRIFLGEELGLDPSPELRRLEQQILDHDESLAFSAGPAIRRAAVLVADVGDPDGIARLGATERSVALRLQTDILDDAVTSSGGAVFAHRGSALYASFAGVGAAARAAGAAQRSLSAAGSDLDVRIAIDFGDVEHATDGSVSGPPVGRSATLVAAAHGGQVLLTGTAHDELTGDGGAGWMIVGLGTHEFAGIDNGLAVHQLVVDGRPTSYPPLRTDALPPPLPVSAAGVPGYELREEVGSGAFGVVHRGYQPSVGREVAVKIIRPEFANSPEFIRRFEVEAQLVARLEHPHIVPLHDYWRGPDGGFLVMRWLRGGSLQDRLETGPLTHENARTLLTQVASALAYAHRHGVVHRDIKPSNVLFDEEGNAYLSDFGIAVAVATDAGACDDCVALAELVNAAVGDGVIDAGAGYDDIAAVVTAWEEATGAEAGARDLTFTPVRNPYKGLRAFGELDAPDFHGRDAEVAGLIDTLETHRLVAVVGPSGIGKSSVVRAGLIPALRRGAIAGADEWLMTDMLPGAYPFEELASALLRVAVDAPSDLEEQLRRDERGLVRVAKRFLPDGATLLLVVDQFEELFTLSAGDEVRSAFLSLLAATVADERSNVRIVVTMRADYFDRPLRFADLGEALRAGTVPISAPSGSELEAMVAEPARGVGVAFEAGLVERIVADVKGQPGALPLLEFALTELFAGRDSDVLTADAYDVSAGVLGALGRRAESIYLDMDDQRRDVARQVFLRLVNVADSGRDTRRRVRVSELHRLGFPEGALDGVLASFGEHRLLTFDRDPVTRGPTVEVAHEAILSEWERLAGWISEHREDLLLHSRLAEAVDEWETADRGASYLLAGGRLTQHEAWTADTELSLTTSERELLAASRARADELRAQRRRVRRLVMSGFGVAALIAVVLAVGAIVARSEAQRERDRAQVQADLAALEAARAEENAEAASDQADRADDNARLAAEQATLAKARELAASAIGVLDDDPELATLLALEAFDTAPDGAELFPEALIALRQSVNANRLVDRIPTTSSEAVAFTPDGSGLLVVDSGERSVSRHQVDTSGRIQGDDGWVYHDPTTNDTMTFAFMHPDGDVVALAIANEDFGGEPGELVVVDEDGSDGKPGRIILLDVSTGEMLGEVPLDPCEQSAYGPSWFSSDGSLMGLGIGGVDGTAECPPELPDSYVILDTETWSEVARIENALVTMTDDMSEILVSPFPPRSGPAELLAWPSLDLIDTFDIRGPAAITGDGRTITYLDAPINRLGFWDVETNRHLAWADGATGLNQFGGPTTPEGHVLVASTDHDALYDPRTGLPLITLPSGQTTGTAVSENGRLAATSVQDAVNVWNLGARSETVSLTDGPSELIWINPDAFGEGPRPILWGLIAAGDGLGSRIAVLDGDIGRVIAYRDAQQAWSQLPDGRIALVATELNELGNPLDDLLGPVTIWDPLTGEEIVLDDCRAPRADYSPPDGNGPLRGYVCPDGNVSFSYAVGASTDGRVLVAVGHDPTEAPPHPSRDSPAVMRVWDLSSLEVLDTHELPVPSDLSDQTIHVADGWAAFLTFDRTLSVVDLRTGELIADLKEEVDLREAFAVSDDEARLYLVNLAGVVSEFDTETWKMTRRWAAMDAKPRGLSLSPDDRFLAVSGEDELISIWDLSADEPVLVDRIPVEGWASDTVWLDDDRMGVAVKPPGFRAEWWVVDLDPAVVIAQARDMLVRDFTETECRTYGIERCRGG